MLIITNPAIDPKIGTPVLPDTGIVTLFIVNFIRLGFIIGAVIFVFMLIMGSLEYISAGGEKEKVGNAQKRITQALIGIAILFSLFAITSVVRIIFGINILQLDVPVIQ